VPSSRPGCRHASAGFRFGNLINSGKISEVATGFLIGAVVMAVGGLAEVFLGVRSEQRPSNVGSGH
jgi:hypothetical protein